MTTSKSVRDIIVAFAKEWGVPIAEVEQLTSQATIDRMPSTKTADSWDNGTVFADEGFEPPKPSGNAVSQDTLSLHDTKEAEMLGRYQDLGLLGMGSMGEVRLVRDPDLRRTLAMKILHQRLVEKPRIVSRFIEEAQVEAQLQHRNIVPVHELGCLPNGRHYFTMKQIRGTEFSKKIQGVHQHSSQERWRKATDGTSFRDLIRIFQQVCETVAFAHSQGVIHRDLKPDNVMIGDFGEVLVVDWGLAKVLERAEPEFHDEDQVETDRSTSQAHQTRMGTIAGTPCYMAPEQAFGRTEEVGTGTDVYTLGAILYEILSGARPFQGATVEAILDQVKHGLPPALRSVLDRNIEDREQEDSAGQGSDGTVPLLNKIPDRLAEICDKAMQREIGDRTNSAGVMAADLKSWLEGAEKRDKGREEVARAQQLVEEAQNVEKASILAWEEANRLIARDGACSVAGWASWDQHRDAAASGRLLRRRYVRRLQGALVHAPELEEAHEALAELRMEELVLAAALGDRLGQETLNQQLSAHLKFLPLSAQQSIQECLRTRVADKISSQRLRRGTIVGRRLQREAVAAQVESGARLITVFGTAGVGKTRLALELAEDLRPEFSRTVFCNLTEATDPMEVMLHLSRALNVRLRDTDPAIHLEEVLSAQPTLLLLDNLEQIASVVGAMITDWLRCSESLRVVGTSRQKLGIEEEVVVSVEPLSLLEGVDLFVRRGQVADQRFDLEPDNRETVCSLVNKLDGLPLAIELAAARLNIFDLDALLQRLDERFSLLRSRGRDSKGLDGALDWSWGLLEPWAKAALSQASLFRRGFTLEAAEGVIRVGDDAKIPGMFDILGALVDNSLMRNDQVDGGGVRYTLLESIRAYASDKLNVSGEDESDLLGPKAKVQAQHRHAAHFAQLGADDALKALDSFGGGARWEELFNELDNLVVGAEYGTSETAPYCCLAALKVLSMKGPVSLGLDVATDVLERQGIPKRVQMLIEIERSRCLRISGRLAEAREMVSADTSLPPEEPAEAPLEAEAPVVEAPVAAELVLEVDEAPSDPELMEAEQLQELGHIAYGQGQGDEAIRSFEGARDLYRKVGNGAGESRALQNLGNVYSRVGDSEQAIALYQEALAINREVGNEVDEGGILASLATVHLNMDQYEQAEALYGQALKHHQHTGNRLAEGTVQGNLANLYIVKGDYPRAVDLLKLTVDIRREVGDKHGEGIDYGNLGDALFKLDKFDDAELAFERAIAICDEAVPPAAGVFRGSLALLLGHRGLFDEAMAVFEVGDALVEPIADEQIKFLCKKGQVQCQAGDESGAKETLMRARKRAGELKLKADGELERVLLALQDAIASVGSSEPEALSTNPEIQMVVESEALQQLGEQALQTAHEKGTKKSLLYDVQAVEE